MKNQNESFCGQRIHSIYYAAPQQDHDKENDGPGRQRQVELAWAQPSKVIEVDPARLQHALFMCKKRRRPRTIKVLH